MGAKKFESSREKLAEAEEKAEKAKEGAKISRRKFMQGVGGTIAGASLGKLIGDEISKGGSRRKFSSGVETNENQEIAVNWNLYYSSLDNMENRRGGNHFIETVFKQAREGFRNTDSSQNRINKLREIEATKIEDGDIEFWNEDGRDHLRFSPHGLSISNPENMERDYGIKINLSFLSQEEYQKEFYAASGLRYETPGGGEWNLRVVNDGWAPEYEIGMTGAVLDPGELRSSSFALFEDKNELIGTENIFSIIGVFVDCETGEARYCPLELEFEVRERRN